MEFQSVLRIRYSQFLLWKWIFWTQKIENFQVIVESYKCGMQIENTSKFEQFMKSNRIEVLITAIWMRFDSIADVLVPAEFCALFQKNCALFLKGLVCNIYDEYPWIWDWWFWWIYGEHILNLWTAQKNFQNWTILT